MSERVERELAQELGFDIREGESISGHKYAVSGRNDRPCDAVEAYKLWRKCVELKLAQASREATLRECAEIAFSNSFDDAGANVYRRILALLPKEESNVQ